MRRQVLEWLIGLMALALLGFWLGGTGLATPSSARTAAAQEPAAQRVFLGNCVECHGENGGGTLEGPSLRAIPDDEEAVPGVIEVVRDGFGDMDPFGDELSDAEIDAVSRYVVSEFGTTGDVSDGGVLYRLNCAGCHGAHGRGGALIYSEENAPSLLHVSQAKNVSAVRSGPGEMPAFNQAALSDEQTASVVEYVEALKSPPGEGGLDLVYPGPVVEGLVALAVGLGAAVVGAWWVERGGRG